MEEEIFLRSLLTQLHFQRLLFEFTEQTVHMLLMLWLYFQYCIAPTFIKPAAFPVLLYFLEYQMYFIELQFIKLMKFHGKWLSCQWFDKYLMISVILYYSISNCGIPQGGAGTNNIYIIHVFLRQYHSKVQHT